MKRFPPIITALFLVATVLTPVLPAHADVAPPPPPAGMNIRPDDEQTQVRMVSEKVIIEVAAQSSEPTGQAYITASFLMRNLGTTIEKMPVRFPLCSGYSGNDVYGCEEYPPIDNFRVTVDGIAQTVENTYEKHYFSDGSWKQLPAWAHFPVIFPSGKDVIIEVQYSQVGYNRSGPSYSEFRYILATGAGWKDTIGTADIIFRLPMKADDTTLYSYQPFTDYLESPNSVVFVDNEIRWHLEDYEPSQQELVSVTILQPQVWHKIQTEKKNVNLHPNDGEAWGRLGKAYKTAIIQEKGHIRPDEIGEEMYRESVQAYQKAVDLLPNDADWHYGYADLLSYNLFFNQFVKDGEDEQALLIQTVQQLKQALDINPDHKNAQELLKMIAEPGIIDLTDEQPDYIILTPKAATRTSTPTFTVTPVIPTVTKLPAKTSTLSALPRNTPHLLETTTSTEVISTQIPGSAEGSGICKVAIIPGAMVLLFFAAVRIKKRQ